MFVGDANVMSMHFASNPKPFEEVKCIWILTLTATTVDFPHWIPNQARGLDAPIWLAE